MQELIWYVMMFSDDPLLSMSKFSLNMFQVFLWSLKDMNMNTSWDEGMGTHLGTFDYGSFKVDLSSGFTSMIFLIFIFFAYSS